MKKKTISVSQSRLFGRNFRRGCLGALGLALGCTLGSAVGAGNLLAQATVRPASPPTLVPGAAPVAEVAPAKPLPPKTATSRITQVTVYPDTALVTREVQVPEAKGLHEVVVGALPATVVGNSLYGEGVEGIRVLATRYRTRAVEADTRKEVRELQMEEEKLNFETQRIASESKTMEANVAFLAKLEAFASATTTASTEKAKLDSLQVTKLATFLMETRKEQNQKIHEHNIQSQEIQKKIQFLQRKRNELASGSSRTENEAVLVVERVAPGAKSAKLSYLVEAASWRPQYRLRSGNGGVLDQKKDQPPQLPGERADAFVKVEYLAAVTQQSGEDWSGVSLVLSNAQPLLNAAPPELRALAVAVGSAGGRLPTPGFGPAGGRQPTVNAPAAPQQQAVPQPQLGRVQNLDNIKKALEGQTQQLEIINPQGNNSAEELAGAAKQLRTRAQNDLNRSNSYQSNEIFNYAGALDQARDLTLLADEKPGVSKPVSRGEGPSITHRLPGVTTISSRNDEQVLEVARFDLPADTFYKAVPVLTPHVYRQSNLANKSGFVILPGEATMYHMGDFVGKMNLPLVAVGEQFVVGFGAEPQLQVQRTLMEKTRTTQGGNQVLKFDYRFLVSSYLKEKVKLQVWDRLPWAEGEAVSVTIGKTEPELSKDALYLREERPRNLLRWDLEILPGQSGEKAKKVTYDFRMELDKNMSIGSFMSK